MGEYVHIGSTRTAIHIKILNKRMPDRIFDLLASRILEHVRANDVLNPRLLRFMKRGGKRVLSMLMNQNQLRTSTDAQLKRVLIKAIRTSDHIVLKQANHGGSTV